MSEENHFDIIVNIPLEEELQAFLEIFEHKEDHSTDGQYRCEINTESDLTMLAVLQSEMGKSSASNSTTEILAEFSCHLFICLGIAGGLSKDVTLGDVCYSGNVLDLNDNMKSKDGKNGGLDLEFSPYTYRTDKALSLALDFVRRDPDWRRKYIKWQDLRLKRTKELIDNSHRDPKFGHNRKTGPNTVGGTIACGVVSAGKEYNQKILQIDRKILAIDTESGGVFNITSRKGVETLTIRGISDYADSMKAELEVNTSGVFRTLAAENAASFLKLQLENEKFIEQIRNPKKAMRRAENEIVPRQKSKSLEELVDICRESIDKRLRELSPEYRLHPKGYQMPLPSVVKNKQREGSGEPLEPIHDIVECLRSEDHIYIALDKSYPDKSVPWVVADHLLNSEIDQVQLLPIVVEGNSVKPPHYTIDVAAPFIRECGRKDRQVVIIFDSIPLSSRTRTKFILNQVNCYKNAKYIFIDRTEANFFMQTEFANAVAATAYRLCDISFLQLVYFVQRNFDVNGTESEAIAKRLRDTFKRFQLNAHPAYFAGIPREMLEALIQANRRTELLQLGVDGFLSILVAGDQAKISLSRTTRSKFLRQLVVEINVNKQNFDETALID